MSETKPASKPARRSRPKASVAAYGEPMVWLSGGALCVCLFMILGLLTLIVLQGISTFWPGEAVKIELANGEYRMGEVTREEYFKIDTDALNTLPIREEALAMVQRFKGDPISRKRLVRVGNYEIFNRRFEWIDDLAMRAPQYEVFTNKEIKAALDALPDDQKSGLKIYMTGKSEALDYTSIPNWETPLAFQMTEAMHKALEPTLAPGEKVYYLLKEAKEEKRKDFIDAEEIERTEVSWPRAADPVKSSFEEAKDKAVYAIVIEKPAKAEDELPYSFPEWALLLERRKDGIFMGLPDALTVRTSLEQMIEAYKSTPDKWSTIQVQLAGVDENLSLEDAFKRIERFNSVLGSEEAFAFHSTPEGSKTLYIGDDEGDGFQIWSKEEAIGKPVIAIIDVFNGNESAWKGYQRFHSECLKRYNEAEDLRHKAKDEDDSPDARLAYSHVELSEYQNKYKWDDSLEAEPNAAWIDAFDAIEAVKFDIEGLQARLKYFKEFKLPNGQPDPDQRNIIRTTEELRLLEEAKEEKLARFTEDLKTLEVTETAPSKELQEARRKYLRIVMESKEKSFIRTQQIKHLEDTNESYMLIMHVVELPADQDEEINESKIVELIMGDHDRDYNKPFKKQGLASIVRAVPVNRIGTSEKFSVYLSRWWEFLWDEPREGNMEGGVFPAIFGTVVMTMLMVLVVVPFGVMAALYLREYAKAGPIISAIRIAINNLAGVPSIVYGVFGFGFFCYLVGGFIDGGSEVADLPSLADYGFQKGQAIGVWLVMVLAMVIAMGLAIFVGMLSLKKSKTANSAITKFIPYMAAGAWAIAGISLICVIVFNPFYYGLFQNNIGDSTFGKGTLVWASMTLALLTLPVVIVATEEALSAVPNSMREGSYACGASKWQTIKRIVLPRAMPGIMTGMILAMARGAGEVAPLMLVGAVKYVTELPFDFNDLPTLGLDRRFMHLGFHIYDVGFQSTDSEAAKPMVFTTTLLLITIVALLNITAILIRAQLRKKFAGSQF